MPEDKTFKVMIVTPERIVYQDYCDYISIPGSEGVIGVLKGHSPLYSRITQGEVEIHKGKDRFHLSVAGGFVEVEKGMVAILADSALRSEDIDEEKIREARKAAEEKLQQKLSKQEFVATEAELRKLLLDIKVAEKKRRSLAKLN